MQPYFQDESVTLYHGDSLEVLPTLQPDSVDVLLTDPPYFNVKPDAWDRQWSERDEFLRWMGSALDVTTPALRASASVWVFASPALASTIELEVIAPRFRVLNSIRWVKENGWHQRAEIAAQRRYLTAWEGVLLAEFRTDGTLHPILDYLNACRESAGVTIKDVTLRWQAMRGSKGQMPGHWFTTSQWAMPTESHYRWLRDEFGAAHFPRDYDDLRQQFDDLRRTFTIDRATGPVTDVWNFPTVKPYPGKHPCEKPESMLAHMIESTSRVGDLILDPFAGSGSTLRAAKAAGRRAIGIEQDEAYCRQIVQSLTPSQEPLFV